MPEFHKLLENVDLNNDFKSTIFETHQRIISPFMRLFGRNSKNIYNLPKIMLHVTTWTLILMLHIKQSIYLVLTNVLSISFLMFHITFIEISTTQFWYKGRYTRYLWSMICSYFEIAFLLFLEIENAVYTSYQNSTLLFINEFIFDIMNTQNNQSLQFEWKSMLAPLRSVNDQRFSWLHNVFLKIFQDWLNSVQKYQENFERDALTRKCSYSVANIWRIENKH